MRCYKSCFTLLLISLFGVHPALLTHASQSKLEICIVGIVIIATYLTFFPVTIAVMRGLRSPDPRAIELMRSYASSKWHIYW